MKRIALTVLFLCLLASYGFSTIITDTGATSSGIIGGSNYNSMSEYYYPYEYSYSCGFLGWDTCYDTAYNSGSGGSGVTTSTTSYSYLYIDPVSIPTDATVLSASLDWSSSLYNTYSSGYDTYCTQYNTSYSGYSCGSFGGSLTSYGQSVGLYDGTTGVHYYPTGSDPIDLFAAGFGTAVADGDNLYLEVGTTAGGYGYIGSYGYNDYTSGYGYEGANFTDTAKLSVTYSEVPEPATLTLFGLGMSGVAGLLRRRRSRR